MFFFQWARSISQIYQLNLAIIDLKHKVHSSYYEVALFRKMSSEKTNLFLSMYLKYKSKFAIDYKYLTNQNTKSLGSCELRNREEKSPYFLSRGIWQRQRRRVREAMPRSISMHFAVSQWIYKPLKHC